MRKVLLIGLALYLVIGLAVAVIARPEQWYACPSRAPGGQMMHSSLDEAPRSVRDECRATVTLTDRITWFGVATPLWPGLVGLLGLHHQNDVALMKCERIAMAQGEDAAGIVFQWTPPGWICETDAGTKHLGLWLR